MFLRESFQDVDAERVVAAIRDVPGFGDDLDAAVEAATGSSSDEKIKLLASVLRAELSARDQAAVDNAPLIPRRGSREPGPSTKFSPIRTPSSTWS